MSSPIQVRPATEADIPDIIRLIRELADYEKALEKAQATPELLKKSLFPEPGQDRYANCLVAQETKVGGAVVGMALYFFNFSTWLARPGLYLEDLYVTPATRGTGVGKMLFRELGKIALEKGCGRIDWSVLDWNQPAIDFYVHGIGAAVQDEWKSVRIEGDEGIKKLIKLA